MYRVNEVAVSLEDNLDKENLYNVLANFFHVRKQDIKNFTIVKKSLDARKKSNIHYKYNFDVEFDKNVEKIVVNKFNLQKVEKEIYVTPKIEKQKRVVVVGSGPSGLFAALELVKSNVKVVLLERGECIEDRVKTVEELLKTGKLNKESNIQFGEGGAGTFSDGKLNTGINSPLVNQVLRTFYENGAEENVLYDNKAHIGTDQLRSVVKNIRNNIIKLGGEVKFKTKFVDFKTDKDKVEVIYENCGAQGKIIADDLILALGYSARDTHRVMNKKGLEYMQKPFSVGYRIEHLQEDINKAQYGENYNKLLPPADYKLFAHLENKRTVYTFCMCPGGEVVPAISGDNQIVTNGMSYHARDGKNANSAILVSVDEKDYKSSDALAGLKFQEQLERNAYKEGNGKFIVSRVEDFMNNKETVKLTKVNPTIKPYYSLGNVYKLLPKELSESIKQGLVILGKKLKGFDDKDAILTGIETRSSAPFMVKRNESLSTSINHVYSVGEGAGMAGGIVSSAVDGLKVARKIIENYLKEEK